VKSRSQYFIKIGISILFKIRYICWTRGAKKHHHPVCMPLLSLELWRLKLSCRKRVVYCAREIWENVALIHNWRLRSIILSVFCGNWKIDGYYYCAQKPFCRNGSKTDFRKEERLKVLLLLETQKGNRMWNRYKILMPRVFHQDPFILLLGRSAQ
jgi:hypothetical protein